MRRSLLLIPLCLFWATSGTAHALQGESIFLKALGGVGYSFINQTDKDTKLAFTGLTGMTYLQAGGSLSPAFKLFAFTGLTYGPKPSVKTEGIKIDTEYSFISIIDFGLGVAYYLPSGLHASLGFSVATNYFKYTVYGTDVGVYTRHGWGANLIVGQEFPINRRLSYGVSLISYYGRVFDVGPAADAPVSNLYFGLAASLMYD